MNGSQQQNTLTPLKQFLIRGVCTSRGYKKRSKRVSATSQFIETSKVNQYANRKKLLIIKLLSSIAQLSSFTDFKHNQQLISVSIISRSTVCSGHEWTCSSDMGAMVSRIRGDQEINVKNHRYKLYGHTNADQVQTFQ